jgi:hypothetical protein
MRKMFAISRNRTLAIYVLSSIIFKNKITCAEMNLPLQYFIQVCKMRSRYYKSNSMGAECWERRGTVELTCSVMHQRGCDFCFAFDVHYTTFCNMPKLWLTFYRPCTDGKYDRVPKVYWNRNYITLYACGSVTIYAMKSLLSCLRIESHEINGHGNASFFGQTGAALN